MKKITMLVSFLLLLSLSPFSQSAEATKTLIFEAAVAEMFVKGSLTKGKKPDDIVSAKYPGKIFNPIITIEPKGKKPAGRTTPESTSTLDFHAYRANDAKAILANFDIAEHEKIQRMLDSKDMRQQTYRIYQGYGLKFIMAKAYYKDYVLLFVAYNMPDENRMIETYKKVGNEYKRTSALSGDENYFHMLSAFQRGKIIEQ